MHSPQVLPDGGASQAAGSFNKSAITLGRIQLNFLNMHIIDAKSRGQAGLFCISKDFAPIALKLPWL